MRFLEGEEIYRQVVEEGILTAKTSIWIATANVKDLLLRRRGRAVSIVSVLFDLLERGVDVRLLHASAPSKAFQKDVLSRRRSSGAVFPMRCCPRVHFKTVIVDGKEMYLGSANLTGAGMGGKSAARRNFELGLWVSDPRLIDQVQSTFNLIWEGEECIGCGRKEICYVPLEQPNGKSALSKNL